MLFQDHLLDCGYLADVGTEPTADNYGLQHYKGERIRKIEYFILSIGKCDKDNSGCMVSLAVLLKPSFFLAYSYRY